MVLVLARPQNETRSISNFEDEDRAFENFLTIKLFISKCIFRAKISTFRARNQPEGRVVLENSGTRTSYFRSSYGALLIWPFGSNWPLTFRFESIVKFGTGPGKEWKCRFGLTLGWCWFILLCEFRIALCRPSGSFNLVCQGQNKPDKAQNLSFHRNEISDFFSLWWV